MSKGGGGHVLTTRTLGGVATLVVIALGAHLAGAEDDADIVRYGHLPVAPAFDYPVGPPDAEGYYNAQGFGDNFHLGDDWNGIGGGSSDLGDPVYNVAVGEVTFAGHAGAGWGNVVRVVHHVRHNRTSAFVESVYAHLDTITVEEGQALLRGDRVGTIGDADGAYVPHLHFEIRRMPDLALGPGYSPDTSHHLDPTAFIRAHR
jgi:murein DD-endopeptidase MepM/ murein hydrolase activator NlpD